MIKSMSAKRVEETKVYKAQKKLFLADNPDCEVCGEWLHPADRVLHHVRGRSGSLYLNPDHWMTVCDSCHRKIHTDRKWAIQNGHLGGAGQWGEP